MTRRQFCSIARLASISLLLLAGGCGRINQSNFAKIQPGMSQQQVSVILGLGRENTNLGRGRQFPTNVPGINQKTVQYGSDSRCIIVLFDEGAVKEKRADGL